MDFDLTPEQEQIRKLAHDFADKEIAPGARERDRAEKFPADVLKKMAPLGLLGGPVPEEYGGMGVDYISHAIITEEIGRADSPVARRSPSRSRSWSSRSSSGAARRRSANGSHASAR